MPSIRAAVLAERLLKDREAPKTKSEQAGDTPCFHCGKMFVYRGPRGDKVDFVVINVTPSTIIPDRSRSTPSNLRTGESLLVVIPVTSLRRR
jgi:hypothetical protein